MFRRVLDVNGSGHSSEGQERSPRRVAGPSATDAFQTIAAFASLHVAILVTACLIARLLGLHRFVQWALQGFLALTVLATVYLGWHYFVDVLGGVVLGAAAVWVAAIATDNHVRGRPLLVTGKASDKVLT